MGFIPESTRTNVLSELELLGSNIIKFSDLVTKYSHKTKIEENDKHSITSIAIRLIVEVGDIVNFYK